LSSFEKILFFFFVKFIYIDDHHHLGYNHKIDEEKTVADMPPKSLLLYGNPTSYLLVFIVKQINFLIFYKKKHQKIPFKKDIKVLSFFFSCSLAGCFSFIYLFIYLFKSFKRGGNTIPNFKGMVFPPLFFQWDLLGFCGSMSNF